MREWTHKLGRRLRVFHRLRTDDFVRCYHCDRPLEASLDDARVFGVIVICEQCSLHVEREDQTQIAPKKCASCPSPARSKIKPFCMSYPIDPDGWLYFCDDHGGEYACSWDAYGPTHWIDI